MVTTITSSLNNELNENKFKLVFSEIKNTELLCVGANLPGLDGQPIEIGNRINKMYVQGSKLTYSPLTLTFKVDENLTNYKEIYAWILGIYSPQKLEQFLKFQSNLKIANLGKGTRFGYDATLFTLKNSSNVNMEIQFMNLFPISLSSIDFNLQSTEHVRATANFQYDYYIFK